MTVEALVVIAVAGGFIAGAIADSRGASFGGYFVLGLLLPVIGIVMALVAQPAQKASKAGWWSDPTGRFEHRYFNGQQWTSHVSRDGAPLEDPV